MVKNKAAAATRGLIEKTLVSPGLANAFFKHRVLRRIEIKRISAGNVATHRRGNISSLRKLVGYPVIFCPQMRRNSYTRYVRLE